MKFVNNDTFAETVKDGVVLVDFFANWCGPCKMISPVLEQMDAENDKLTVVKVDVDENPELAAKYGVQSIPNMILFVNGTPSEQMIGFQNKDALMAKIAQYL